MCFRRRRPADKYGNVQSCFVELVADLPHLCEGRCDQSAESDHIGFMLNDRFKYFFRRNHYAKIDDAEMVALQDQRYNILADIVHIAFDGRQHNGTAHILCAFVCFYKIGT